MNSKGFTLLEVLIGAFLTALIAALCLSCFLASRNAYIQSRTTMSLQQRARLSLAKITQGLQQANNCSIKITPCAEKQCFGHIISFQIPVKTATDVANTILHPNGTVKWGTDGIEGAYIFFMVPDSAYSAQHKNRLLRLSGFPGPGLGTIESYSVRV
ncbi:PilW family protein, partial [Candidatus Omnitrophota bacterium]